MFLYFFKLLRNLDFNIKDLVILVILDYEVLVVRKKSFLRNGLVGLRVLGNSCRLSYRDLESCYFGFKIGEFWAFGLDLNILGCDFGFIVFVVLELSFFFEWICIFGL